MKKLLILLAAINFWACSNTTTETTTEATQEEISYEAFGAEITAEGAITPDELLSAIEGKDSIEVKLLATIEETCKKKGCWVTLQMGEGRDLMRVKFKDYGFFLPLDADGRTGIFQGMAYVKTTSVEQLRHYAEDAGKTEEEIAKITEPETKLTLLAEGVLLK